VRFRLLALALATALPVVSSAQEATAARTWAVSAEAYQYFHPDGNFLLPILRADRGALHLEARWHYEDAQTLSAWAGWNWETGETVELALTPMIGVAMGRTNGIAPGLELSLAWKALEFYSENEYLVDFQGRDNNFFYSWSELSWWATDWLRAGVSGQRTRIYDTEREIDHGLLLGLQRGRAGASFYGFNIGGDSPFLMVGLSWEF
jgi:hypothetical protein